MRQSGDIDDMVKSTSSGFWGKHPRLLYGLVVASFMVAIVLGALTPDFDILWQGHKGWTHNPIVPMGVCLGMVILAVMGFTYSRRQSQDGVLKWKR